MYLAYKTDIFCSDESAANTFQVCILFLMNMKFWIDSLQIQYEEHETDLVLCETWQSDVAV